MFNRYAVSKKGDQYRVKQSNDNFGFCISSKSEYVCFNYSTDAQLFKFNDTPNQKSISIANGFIDLKFPEHDNTLLGHINKQN